MLGRFNGFLKSVVLRISEARDLGEFDRFKFYEHLKAYTASPPDVLRCDEKHLREHYVFNCCGVVITTNHKAGGIFLPADDRRHLRGLVDADQGGLRRRLLDQAVGLVRAERPPPRRRLPGRARPRRLRRQGAAAEDARHSGTSSTPAARPRTPSWPTCSTSWRAPTR